MTSPEGGIESSVNVLADRYVARLNALLPFAADAQKRLQYSDLDPYFYLEEDPGWELPPIPPELQPIMDRLTPAEKAAEELPEYVTKAFDTWREAARAKGPAAEDELITIGEEVESQFDSILAAIKQQKKSRQLLAGFAVMAGVNPALKADAYSRDESDLSYQDDKILQEALSAEVAGVGSPNYDVKRAVELMENLSDSLVRYATVLSKIEPLLFLG